MHGQAGMPMENVRCKLNVFFHTLKKPGDDTHWHGDIQYLHFPDVTSFPMDLGFPCAFLEGGRLNLQVHLYCTNRIDIATPCDASERANEQHDTVMF